ncbi:hypothetical protein GF342_05950 [Candidatus Woesearchaeota archaeon]|nr:hypothetical protein [Candidatus Woesearchaeota archaeon]
MGVLDTFRGLFKKEPKKEEKKEVKNVVDKAPADPVVDYIISQRNKGIGDDDIIATLLKHGHQDDDIKEAMKKADKAMGVEPMDTKELPEPTPNGTSKMPEGVEIIEPSKALAEIQNMVDDRVKEVQDDVAELAKWRSQVDADLQGLEAEVKDIKSMLKQRREEDQSRFQRYDQHLSEVKVELKAMQEVFQKGLPEFTKGIQELSRIVKKQK